MTPDPSLVQVDLPPFSREANLTPSSINEAARTVDLVFTTGAAVRRFDWWTGKAYLEKLSMKPEHVRLDRLNAGGPLLNSHSSWSLSGQVGVVEPDSARMNGKDGTATVRFSRRQDVEPIWTDVKDRIVRNVSVGYAVHRFEETAGKDGGIPTRLATDWEPFEVSLVPMPADPAAQVRGADGVPAKNSPQPSRLFPCDIIVRGASPADVSPEESTMDPEKSETIVERNPLDPGAPTNVRTDPAALPAEPTDAQVGANLERDRITGITQACRAARMPAETMDRLIREQTPLVKAQAFIFEELRKRGLDAEGPQVGAVRDVRLTGDPMLHVRAGIENALLHRLAPAHFKLDEVGRNYRGMNLLDIGRAILQARGVRVTNLSKNQLAGEALGLRGGMHTTSDYADLLADVANKTLRRAYDEQAPTFGPLVTRVSLPDYKYVKRLQFGDAPELLEVKEHGEYTSGTIGEGKEQYRLIKYGRKFAITREAIINDDTDAFARVPMMFGRKARVLEADLVWEQITSNPTMGDGNALFSAAHANLQTDGDHISIVSLGRARAALRNQTSLDGALMNLTGKFLIVPPSLETVADQFVTAITAQASTVVNPFAGRLTVIADPRLEAAPLAWYMAASPDQIDMIELGYLEGEEGPQVESRVGFDVDGVEIKCRLDVGTKVIDWRGFHKDPGDLAS